MSARLWFGGDYNPEQWTAPTWAEDDELMRAARVSTVTVGVFAWSSLEPQEGRFVFDELDRTLERLHANGIGVVLATPTASPPPWFSLAHPDALPVGADGTRLWHGSRDTYCAAAPAYREAALRIATAMAERYGTHPALALWHVHNEYGTLCHCDHAAAGFRRWLRRRYHDDLGELNTAWNTPFWSQGYGEWEQILPPRATQYRPNPSQTLDFSRFWSDELLAAYLEQRDLLRRHSPGIGVTTNFIMSSDYQNLDLWRWSREVDVVATDLYPGATGATGRAELAFGADLSRSLGRGRPWLLMEQAPSVVQLAGTGVAAAKEPGAMRSDSLGYVARGSDSVMFFQWRASPAGAELHHCAMVPHAGPDTRVFREVTALGADVGRLAEVAGSTVEAPVAVLWDVEGWWALNSRGLPSALMSYLPAVREVHTALWQAGIVTDFAHPDDDLSRYQAVFAPSVYLLGDCGAASLRRYVHGGGQLLVGCFAGVCDERHRIRRGGYPGGLMDVLGLRVEEFHPLGADQSVTLSGGETGTLWSEDLRTEGAQVLAAYTVGPLAGQPAVTVNRYGTGAGWYVSTRLVAPALTDLVGRVLAAAGVSPQPAGLPPGIEAVRRRAADGRSWLFVTNHGDTECELPAAGEDLLTGRPVDPVLCLPPGGVAVLRQD